MHVHEGWSPEEVARTKGIISHAEQKKSLFVKTIDNLLYWVALFLAILGNFVLSVVFVPYLLVLQGIALYSTIFFIAFSFGVLFSFILHTIEMVDVGHKLVASVLIPSLALISLGIIVLLSNKLVLLLGLTTPPHNPIFVGIVYVIGYILPDTVTHVRSKYGVLHR